MALSNVVTECLRMVGNPQGQEAEAGPETRPPFFWTRRNWLYQMALIEPVHKRVAGAGEGGR